MKRVFVVVLLAGVVGSAFAQLRIVNYNVAQLNGNLSSMTDVFAALNADDKPGFAVAPHLYVFQEVQQADRIPLLNMLNAAATPGVTYAAGVFTGSVAEDGAGGAQALYYRTDTLSEDVSGHLDLATGAGRNTDRWRMRLVGYSSPEVAFYVYSSHLKAGNTAADENERANGANVIRASSNALPAGTHIIYAGDFNLYTNTEPAYMNFTAAGNGQAVDPLGPANWTGSGNALKHTQSPCGEASCALVGGGMDDRFDFQLSTSALNDGEGLARIVGASMYRSLGNDGLHYNVSINTGNNSYYPADISRSNALALDLFNASDHIPVVCEYQIPAIMAASLPASLGRVIQSAAVDATLTVSNLAAALVPGGADELDFSATASGALSGSASGVIAALAAPANRTFAMNTSSVGNVTGSVLVTSSSQGAQNASLVRNTSATVVRHSTASFDAAVTTTSRTLRGVFEIGTGVVPFAMTVYNRGFDALQATLDLDSASGLSGPLSLTSGLATGIGAAPAALTVSLDTDAAASGLQNQLMQIVTSDEDLPGATTGVLEVLFQLRLRVLLPDSDNDCDVDLSDLSVVLGRFGSCAGEALYDFEADFNNDGCVDLSDLALLLGQFGAACP
jgi:hypothetical protein